VIKQYIEQREWAWDEGERKVWLSFNPDSGIVLTTGDEYNAVGSVHSIPPEVALRMASYLTEMAHEINRKIAGGWAGAPELDNDDYTVNRYGEDE